MPRPQSGYRFLALGFCALMLGACAVTPTASSRIAPPPNDAGETSADPDLGLLWRDARQLTMEGRGWCDTETYYNRLPHRAESEVPTAVWQLSKHTSGICVRFVTNSARIGARWDGGGAMNHMAATGNSGLDLYVRRGDAWIYRGTGKPKQAETTAILARSQPAAATEYLLYLPLYQGVTELAVGIEPGARITAADPRKPADRPMVFYGTSITQGGCASRAGMSHPAILGRWLDREVINLGFSGAGKMEAAMAELLAELDAAVYVLECLPNMTDAMLRERAAPFVRSLRAARPTTPILLVENPIAPDSNSGNRILREIFTELTAEGVSGLHYLPGAGLLAGRENGTVDGVHPTDLGFERMAGAYEATLRRILAGSLP